MAMDRWASGALTVLVVGAVVSTITGRASACSLDPCPSSVGLPPTRYLPGNLVYFQIVGDDPPAIALRTAEGEPIAASIRTIGNDRVFAPEEPIAESTQLVLEYSIPCIGLEPSNTLPQTFEFMTTAPGEIELIPARLEIEETGVRHPGRDSETSFVRVRHWPGDGNGNASSLMKHTYTVDGLPVWSRQIDGVDLIEVPVACRSQVVGALRDSCGRLDTAPPGVHTVEVSTHVIGATTQPEPVSLQVDVSCPDTDAADSSDDHEPEPSTPDQEMAEPSEPTSDTALPAGMSFGDVEGGGDPLPEPAAVPVVSSSGGGCTLGSSGAQSGRSALLALVAAFMLGRARRRTPRPQP
jgi:hypothetical protein